jgi:hypothetical protein
MIGLIISRLKHNKPELAHVLIKLSKDTLSYPPCPLDERSAAEHAEGNLPMCFGQDVARHDDYARATSTAPPHLTPLALTSPTTYCSRDLPFSHIL